MNRDPIDESRRTCETEPEREELSDEELATVTGGGVDGTHNL